ncbi:hypothetical protein BDFG_05279 [Blastomyces dermatitidis ATCC 26199]|nr:hypothetical protein BDFG_05279 [Blastomyces dermatitidis ATCC 26199]
MMSFKKKSTAVKTDILLSQREYDALLHMSDREEKTDETISKKIDEKTDEEKMSENKMKENNESEELEF